MITTKALGKPFGVYFFYHNLSPLAILMAICFFKYFVSINIKSAFFCKFWTVLGSCAFGIYLIHMTPFAKYVIFPFLKQYAQSSPLTYTLVTLGSVLGIFIGCVVVDFIRQKLFKVLKVRKLCDKTFDKVDKTFSSLLKIDNNVNVESD